MNNLFFFKISPALFLLISSLAFAWGDLGHRIVAGTGAESVSAQILTNCHVTSSQLVDHTNDPDKVWRNQKRKFPKEDLAHFFHVDKQPGDWRSRQAARDPEYGYLVYRIVSWIEESKKLRKEEKWDELAVKLYGLSHYLGDLAQPLHLINDYDGRAAGLPDIHSQFETKMLNRYESEIRAEVKKKFLERKNTNGGAPWSKIWDKSDYPNLIFSTAEESASKASSIFAAGKKASAEQNSKKSKRKKKPGTKQSLRYAKKILWENTKDLTSSQLTMAAQLWAYTLTQVCK